MTTTSLYDHDPTQPYGYGENGEKFWTEEEANAYMRTTFLEAKKQGGNSGKRVTVTNPTRATRVRRAVLREIDVALHGCSNSGFPSIQRLIDQHHITEEEADQAMLHSELYDIWMEWREGWRE